MAAGFPELTAEPGELGVDVEYAPPAMPTDLLRTALDRLDVDFHQGYGMTKTGGDPGRRPHPQVKVRIGDDGEILGARPPSCHQRLA